MPDRENSGVLFKNDKGDNPSRPDYTGFWTDANGTEWRLAAWIKEGKKGKFMSLKASEKRDGGQRTTPDPQAPLDDDRPPF